MTVADVMRGKISDEIIQKSQSISFIDDRFFFFTAMKIQVEVFCVVTL
jgi:hypothetical protein